MTLKIYGCIQTVAQFLLIIVFAATGGRSDSSPISTNQASFPLSIPLSESLLYTRMTG